MSESTESRKSLPYRAIPLAQLQETASCGSAALPFLLAVKFNYDVNQGGFSQFVYNMRGNFLAETEEMLKAAGARVAHGFYVRAVSLCLADTQEYSRFIESDYRDANAVKESLQLLSIEYLQQPTDFETEAAEFLASCPRP